MKMGFFVSFFSSSFPLPLPLCCMPNHNPAPTTSSHDGIPNWISNGYYRSGLEGWPKNPTIRCHLLTANKSVLVPGMSITEREKSLQQRPRIMPRFCEPSQLQPKKRSKETGRGGGLLRYKRTHHPLKLSPKPICQTRRISSSSSSVLLLSLPPFSSQFSTVRFQTVQQRQT